MAFGAGFDAMERAAFHHEADWVDEVPYRRVATWIAEALPDYQPGAPAVVNGVKYPLPCGGHFFWRSRDGATARVFGSAPTRVRMLGGRVLGHPEAGCPSRGKEDQVAGVQLLKLRDYPVGTMNVAPHQVFERIVTVEAPAAWPIWTSQDQTSCSGALMVMARVEVIFGLGTSSSPGMVAETSAGVAPHRLCDPRNTEVVRIAAAILAPPSMTSR